MAIIELNGDKDECLAWLSFAKTKSYYLDDYMKKAGLKQGEKSISPQPGVDIKYSKRFNTEKIIISVNAGVVAKGRPEKCVCNCNFSIGQIVKVNPVDGQDFDLLDIICCKEKRSYILYEDLLGSDFTPWELEQVVVVMAYNEFLYDCYNSNYNATGCLPIPFGEVTILDVESEKLETIEVLDNEWRTTYRVVPFCGLKVPKWVR